MSPFERSRFKRILCPIDLSAGPNQALQYAARLARASCARLFVLHVLDGESVGRVRDYDGVSRIIDSHFTGPNAIPDWQSVIVEGQPDLEICQQAAQQNIDLIVMRSRRRPYAAALLGSITESVCRTAPCPVLVTHDQEREWTGLGGDSPAVRRILVAYDFSSDSELALTYGLSMARDYDAELHVLHVLPAQPKQGTPEIARLPLAAHDAFTGAVAALNKAVPAHLIPPSKLSFTVRDGKPYREILAYADEQEIELICMGVSGTGFGMRALFGSNVDRVLRQAGCPVLIARPLKPHVVQSDSIQPRAAEIKKLAV